MLRCGKQTEQDREVIVHYLSNKIKGVTLSPTKKAKKLTIERYLKLLPKKTVKKTTKSRIYLMNGSVIRVISQEEFKRLRGMHEKNIIGGVVDLDSFERWNSLQNKARR